MRRPSRPLPYSAPEDLARHFEPVPPTVAEELRLLEVVLRAVHAPSNRRTFENYDAELLRLRDAILDERLDEDRASLVEQMDRVARLSVQRGAFTAAAVDAASPYFGHLRLEDEDGTTRDILIGRQTFVAGGVRIVDWRNAPISKLFYQKEEGDDFDIVIADKMRSGVVLARRTLTIRGGRLLRVSDGTSTWLRGEDGQWREAGRPAPSLHGGEGVAARPDHIQRIFGVGKAGERIDKHLPEIASLLDPAQFDLISRPGAGVLAIQGSAGSGKTTVALHRIAALVFQDPKHFSPTDMMIVVWSRALSRYISKVLPALGIDGVPVRTYDAWAGELCRRHFPRLPIRHSEETPSVVTRLKLHAVMVPMLEAAALAHEGEDPAEVFDELFTDRSWLSGFAKHAPGEFTSSQLDVVHRWCTKQHFIRADGDPRDEDDPPCLDDEDDTILLRLHQLLRGPLQHKKGVPIRYAHLVVDEAQDLSPVELAVLMDTVGKGRPVTLAGDTAQKVLEGNDFRDWGQVLRALGLKHVKVSPLRISYRSTAQIMAVAHEVLGPLAPETPPETTREGAPVELFAFRSRGEAMTFVADALHALALDEPTASVAILTRFPQQADAAYTELHHAEVQNLKRVADQEFSFAPGVEVTDIRQAKGLEFDYVVVLDLDQPTWPEGDDSRHLLHVAITRAAHQCWLVSVGPPTHLLPEGLRADATGAGRRL